MRAGPVAASGNAGSDWLPCRRCVRGDGIARNVRDVRGAAGGGLALVAIYSRLMQSLLSPHGVYTAADVDVALARVFGVGVRPLHIESAVFEAMLAGWRSQQTARYLKAKTIRANEVGRAAVSGACGVLAVGVARVACG